MDRKESRGRRRDQQRQVKRRGDWRPPVYRPPWLRLRRSRSRSPLRVKRSPERKRKRRSRSRSRSPKTRKSSSRRSPSRSATPPYWPDTRIRKTRIIAVINIPPGVTKLQLYELFSFCGKIHRLSLFFLPLASLPFHVAQPQIPFRVCFIQYAASDHAKVALHLSGTLLMDHCLIVIPCGDLTAIPKEEEGADGIWEVVSRQMDNLKPENPKVKGQAEEK